MNQKISAKLRYFSKFKPKYKSNYKLRHKRAKKGTIPGKMKKFSKWKERKKPKNFCGFIAEQIEGCLLNYSIYLRFFRKKYQTIAVCLLFSTLFWSKLSSLLKKKKEFGNLSIYLRFTGNISINSIENSYFN